MSKLKRFNQVPTWEQDSKFEITGAEFLKMKEFFDIFAEPVYVLENIFARHLNSGTIKIKYEDEEGNEMTEEEVQEQIKLAQEQMKKEGN